MKTRTITVTTQQIDTLLNDLQAIPDSPIGSHLSDEECIEYALDMLSHETVPKIEQHIASCPECATQMETLLEAVEIWDKPSEGREKNSPQADLSATPLHHDILSNIIVEDYYWEPVGAGIELTAATSSTQEKKFELEHGTIIITCNWGTVTKTEPAYIWLSWKAQIPDTHQVEIQVIHPVTKKVWYTIVNLTKEGEESFTSDELGFDPCTDQWAILPKCVSPIPM